VSLLERQLSAALKNSINVWNTAWSFRRSDTAAGPCLLHLRAVLGSSRIKTPECHSSLQKINVFVFFLTDT